MRKKILSLILSLVMCLSVFAGCSLFEYDSARDNRQVVAAIVSYEIKDRETGQTFTTDAYNIRKYEVVSLLNNYGSSLSESGYDAEGMVEWAVNYLIMNRVIVNEASAVIEFGRVVWGNYQKAMVKQQIFTTIDNELKNYRNEILTGRNTPATDETTQEEEVFDTSSATYPVKEETVTGKYEHFSREELVAEAVKRIENDEELSDQQKDALILRIGGKPLEDGSVDLQYSTRKLISLIEDYDLQDEYKDGWEPSISRYPGLYGSEAAKSLEKEAMRRFVTGLRDMIKDDFRIDDAARKTYLTELDEVQWINKKDRVERAVPYWYPALGDTELMYYLVGESYENSLRIEALQKDIEDSVNVEDSEIEAYYRNLLQEQKGQYSSADAYATAVRGSIDLQLYIPDESFYFVKHILIPFSELQTAELTKYKNSVNYIKEGEAGLTAFKDTLAKQITSYEHVKGEDFGEPLSIQDISNDIYNTMSRYTSLEERTTAFDDLIYKYNTDSGIFGKQYGYAVQATGSAEDDYDTQYMPEFSKAAKALYEGGAVGAVSEWAVTDYGIHILFYSKKPASGGETLALRDYTNAARQNTVKRIIEDLRLAEKLEAEYANWSSSKQTQFLSADSTYVSLNNKVIKKFVEEMNG